MQGLGKLLLLTAALAAVPSLWAGEFAVLQSGAKLHIERHQADGGKLLLFTGAGTIEMDAAAVRGFEVEEYVAPAQAPAASAPDVHSSAQPALTPQQLADQAAAKYGLPAELVRSVMKAESGYAPQAVSPKGAIGLMQLMPETAKELGADPRDPAQNVDAGTRYLRDLLVKYDHHAYHALAAYNAGPGAVDKYHGVPPYAETHNYILNVLRNWRKQPAD